MTEEKESEGIKTTAEDFEKFKTYCEYWLDKLSLRDFMVYYEHEEMDNCFARCYSRYPDRVARIVLNTNWSDIREISDRQLERSAFHEILHIVLCGFTYYLSFCKTLDEGDIDQISESIINRLTRAFLNGGKVNVKSIIDQSSDQREGTAQ